MSLIDPLSILFSQARAQKSFNGDQASAINGIKNLLVSVGWELVESIPAVASITYPLGAPVAHGPELFPKHLVGCPATPFLGIGSANFSLYNPFTDSPIGGSCTLVPVAENPIGTLSNLASAVSFGTPFNASVVALGPSYFRMDISAKVGGPDFNGVFMDGNGRWGTVANTNGGGYHLRSISDPEATQYDLTILELPSTYGNISMQFTVNGGSTFYTFRDDGRYTIIANGYGFFLRNDNGEGAYPFINYSLFVMAPKMPAAENFDPTTIGVFILGPRSFKNFTYFYGFGSLVSDALNTGFFDAPGGWPKLLVYRNPGQPLQAPNGKPIVCAAYVSFGQGTSNISHIVGKLPDCAIVSTNLTPYGEIEIDSQIYIIVGTQDSSGSASASSFIMLSPLPVSDPVPGNPPPVYPDTQPQQKSGTCNIFGSGVTALTGSFTGLQQFGPITIDGIPYVIQSVEDATHLTLTTASVIKSGVVWTVP